MEKSRWGYHKLAGELKTSPGTEKAKFSQGEGKKSTWSGSSGSQLQRVSNNNFFQNQKKLEAQYFPFFQVSLINLTCIS